ncbi:MAG: putative Ig domain-containing protein [Fulvivirga sp.]
MSVTPAVLTATADDQTKVYGTANPLLTIDYAGFVNGDDATDIIEPTISTTADASSAVGSYPITLSGGSATNYTLSLIDGSLTISKATLIATADNKSRIYNTSNPLLTVSYSGFVNSDNAGNLDVPPTGSTAATISSDVGTYPISFAGGVDNNYNFTYVDGELSILKATATVDVDNLVFTYDGFPKSSTVSTVPSGLTVIITYDGSTTPPINADTYSVEGTVDDTNYNGVGSGTLTINKATALVSISNLYQNYDGSPKPVTVTTNPDGLTTDITYNGSLSVPSARGSYTVVANVVENNYEGSDTETLIINGAPNTSGILDIAVQEDASNTTINLYNAFSDVEDADADLIYSISANTNPGLFSQVFISNGINTLDYEENQYGSAQITVRATDLGGLFVETTYEVTVSPVQDDPEFISSPVTGAVQGQLYQYNIEAGDADPDDVLSIVSALQLPDWLSLTDNGDGTATLTGIPSNSDVGSNPGIALTVDDGNGNDDTQLFNIAISNANDAPYFTSTALVASTEGIVYTYFINTDDDDTGDVLILSAPILPDWLTLTDNGDGTGQITGTPDNDDVGANVVQLRVTDNSNAFTNQDFTIVVENANDAPAITSSPVTSAIEDEFYEYNVTSDDPDVGDNLELRALSKPDWLTFTDNGNGSGLLSGTPTNSNVGSSSIVINVEDQDGANSNQNFTLTVQNVNDKPIFTSSAVTAALQDNLYTYNITTTDPDAGDTRTITATLLPNWLALTDNGNGTATLSGTPDNGDLGANPVVLLVKDVANASSEQPFTINVDNANDPPAFNSSPIITGTEDQLYTYSISTSDPDAGDTRTISALSIPSWLTLLDNGDGTAELTGTPLNQHVGNVSIVLNVRDALGANVNQNFTLNIANTNDDPIFQSTPITSAVQSITYNYQVSVDDPDAGDNVTLTATTLPAWLDFTDNGNGSGSLFGTPTNGDLGSHLVTIRALDDNGGDVYQNFTINVDNSNDPPAFTSSPITSATEDELYLYNITATDPDIGDVLEIEALVIPVWLTLSDEGDGTATLEGTPLNANVGIADVVLELTDAQGISVNQNFSIVVSNTNDPPVFTSSPVTGAIQDQNYTYNIITSDPDLSDSRSIIASIKPSWLSLTDNGNGTASLQGVPSNTDLGSNNVTLEVSDLSGAVTTQNFVINVDNANDPPSFTSTPVTMATEDNLYEYNLTTSDPDIGDTRTLTALSLPNWLSLTDYGDGTGLLSGVPANDDVGNFNVVLNVEDGVGANINQNFTLNVKNTNDAPFFSSSPVPVAVQDVLYTYNITTGDPDVGDSRNIIASTLPSWLNFTDQGDGTAILSGTPSNANLGEHQVVLNVEDEEQAAVDQVFTINVDNANDPPSFESTPITSVLEDDSYNYAISTSDPDVGDIQYITALSKPSWLSLIDNGDGTAVLSGVPKNEHVGIVNVVLNVEDGIGANVNQNFSITVTNTNDAPGFTSSPITGAIQDVQYNYAIQTIDPDIGDTRIIESSTLPAWLTLSDNGDGTASLQGTPTNSNLGLNTVSIKVTDMSGASVNQVFDINVDNQNDPPSFTSSPVTIAKEDVLYTYNITTSDPDAGDTRSINALSLPVWLGLTDNGDGTAILQGIPLNADVGSDNVVLQVVDALGSEDGQSFSITIENVNDAPAFTSTPVVSAQQDIAYNYSITTSDPDVGDTRAISITNKPSWLVFNDIGNGTATLSGTPSNADLGDYEITLTVEDESGVAIDQVFTLTVENANDPPVFTSTPITNASEDSPYTYNITATDPDFDDVLTIVALSKPSWLMLLDNGDGTATLSGTPLNSNVGDNEVVLNVEDDSGANINQSFTIVVANTNDEPTITSSPILSAQQGLSYTYNITTTDVDVGDNLTITSTLTLPDWLGLTDNGDGMAVLSGTPQNSDLGSFNISIKVEDLAGGTDNQAFTLVVDNSNDPPTFDSTPITTTNEDDLFEYEILTSDPDVGDMLSINIIDRPTWLTFEDFGDNTALLSGIALNEHVGVHEIKLRVTDLAGQTVQQNFNLEVINTNDAPVFTSTPQLEIDEDATYEYNVTVQDVDLGNSLTITAEILPDWLSFLDNGDGTAIIEGTPENDDVGVHDIKIRVSDSQGGIVDQDISLNVINTNDPPEITSNPVLSVLEDDNYAYEITVVDPDVGDTFDVTFDNLPEWMVLFEDTDGSVSLLGSPLNEHVGLHDISLTVSDEDGATDIQTFEIEVINTNDDPVFVSTPVIRVVLGQGYSYEVVVNDPDVNDVINLSAELPPYLTFTDNGNGQGEVQGTITNEAFTQNQVTVRASDLEGSASQQLYALQVNTPPEINDFSITTDEDVPFVFTGSDFSDNYSDDENDLLSEIEIESLPQRGSLLLNNQEVVLGQVIVANDLEDLTFHPDLNFFGEDEFTWVASDGFSYSDEAATVSISIVSVNDSPQLITGRQDDILPDLEYALGDPAINLVNEGEIDVRDEDEGDLIAMAQIIIKENYANGDYLEIDEAVASITTSFDSELGIFTIAGEASEATYSRILEQMKFGSPVSGEAQLSDKKIEITVVDNNGAVSNVVSRLVKITEVFPELDIVNAFTPNDDGVNDTWEIENLQFYTDIKISVYTKEGTRVFSCLSQDCAWDGTFKGTELPGGPYLYTIDLNNNRRSYKGTVTILK